MCAYIYEMPAMLFSQKIHYLLEDGCRGGKEGRAACHKS
jgi:hypothetical protein